MNILNVFQILLFSLGSVGVALGLYWYYRQHSPLAIAIVTTASVFAMFLGNMLPYLWLTTSGISAPARVVEVDCRQGEKHHIRYQFSVGTTIVNELGSDGYGNPTCEAIKAGDSGLVTYIPSEPSVHVWGNASEYLGERLAGLLLVLVCVPIFSYAGVRKRVG
ncbi:MAG: hypothetical protein P4L77_15340 [Sulfuriferula sp.]|nr:hypothetical protein [Sulfuriferula sp.]